LDDEQRRVPRALLLDGRGCVAGADRAPEGSSLSFKTGASVMTAKTLAIY
jgi:hypothetical protein